MSWQMWTFIVIAVIALLIGVVALGFRAFGTETEKDRSGETREGSKDVGSFGLLVAGAALAVGLVVLATGVFTVVGTRQVGIVTAFGRPTGQTFQNGLHWKAPWANVSEMDGAIQYDAYREESSNPVSVRLGNNSIAAADVTIRWEIIQTDAPELFVQYKTFDHVRQNLIERNLQVSLNQVLQSFDPLSTKWADGVPLSTFANQAKDHLMGIVGTQVKILDISIAKLDYDDATEAKLNRQNEERANTAVAQQQVKTAQANAEAATVQAEQQVKTAEAQRRAADELSKQQPPNVPAAQAQCAVIMANKGLDPSGCWGQIGVAPVVTTPLR